VREANRLITAQDKGWSMFQAFIEATAVPGGFAAIAHVEREPLVLDDYCESFVFAETQVVSRCSCAV
jgi:hypothetical protein